MEAVPTAFKKDTSMLKRTVKSLALVAALSSVWAMNTSAMAAESIKLGYAKCAHCSAC